MIDFESLLSLAESGDADAQYQVAIAYRNGDGVEQDLSTALDWYQKAGENGNLPAMHEMAMLYKEMLGDKADPNMYVKIVVNAAEKGYAPSQWWLAKTCYDIEQYENAVTWLKKAAECDDESIAADAKIYLSICYCDGLGTAANRYEAFRLIQEVIDSGVESGEYPTALALMGLYHHKGYGTSVNFSEARFWYEKSKQYGHSQADENLANLDRDEHPSFTKSSSSTPAKQEGGVNWGLAILLLLVFFPAGIIYIIAKSKD